MHIPASGSQLLATPPFIARLPNLQVGLAICDEADRGYLWLCSAVVFDDSRFDRLQLYKRRAWKTSLSHRHITNKTRTICNNNFHTTFLFKIGIAKMETTWDVTCVTESSVDIKRMTDLGLESNISTTTKDGVFYYHRGLENVKAKTQILVLLHGYPQT